MKKGIYLGLFFMLLSLFIITGSIQSAGKSEKAGYLIISNNFCIIVRTPSKQLTSMIGQNDLGILLKDKTTQITISGGYLAIAVPVAGIEATIRKYGLQMLRCIE